MLVPQKQKIASNDKIKALLTECLTNKKQMNHRKEGIDCR